MMTHERRPVFASCIWCTRALIEPSLSTIEARTALANAQLFLTLWLGLVLLRGVRELKTRLSVNFSHRKCVGKTKRRGGAVPGRRQWRRSFMVGGLSSVCMAKFVLFLCRAAGMKNLIDSGGRYFFIYGNRNPGKMRLSSRFCVFCGAKREKTSPVRRLSTLN